MATPSWAFNNLAEVWDHRTFAIVSGGEKLDTLPESERRQSLNALATLVHAQAAALDDEWLSHVGMILVEDLFKTFVFGFNPSPGFFHYVAATGNAVLDELSRRGYTLHYVLDATQSADRLEMMLTYLPAFYQAAGFLATGPQLMALEILEQLEEGRREISGIPQAIKEGLEMAERLIKRCHDEKRPSVWLNVDWDNASPGLPLDIPLSPAGSPGAVVIFRNQPPVHGSTAQLYLPPEIRPNSAEWSPAE